MSVKQISKCRRAGLGKTRRSAADKVDSPALRD